MNLFITTMKINNNYNGSDNKENDNDLTIFISSDLKVIHNTL